MHNIILSKESCEVNFDCRVAKGGSLKLDVQGYNVQSSTAGTPEGLFLHVAVQSGLSMQQFGLGNNCQTTVVSKC